MQKRSSYVGRLKGESCCENFVKVLACDVCKAVLPLQLRQRCGYHNFLIWL